MSARRRFVILGIAAIAIATIALVWVRRPAPPPARNPAPAEAKRNDDRDESPRRARPRSPRRPELNAPTTTAAVTTVRTPARLERLADVVEDRAVRSNWMTLDDHDTPCPPDRVRIVYDAPTDLGNYTKGAYFEPLGPAPSETTDEINGLLLCEGSNYLYRGFEAYWRADRQDWDVYPFPVVE